MKASSGPNVKRRPSKITLLVGILFAVAACSGIEEARRVEAMSNSGKCEAADAETDRIANQDFWGAAYFDRITSPSASSRGRVGRRWAGMPEICA
jgi:hypothetical protein